jgi:hypothetical protein
MRSTPAPRPRPRRSKTRWHESLRRSPEQLGRARQHFAPSVSRPRQAKRDHRGARRPGERAPKRRVERERERRVCGRRSANERARRRAREPVELKRAATLADASTARRYRPSRSRCPRPTARPPRTSEVSRPGRPPATRCPPRRGTTFATRVGALLVDRHRLLHLHARRRGRTEHASQLVVAHEVDLVEECLRLEQREIVSFVGRDHPRAEHRQVATALFARWDRKADLQFTRGDVTHDVKRARDDADIFVASADDDARTDRLGGITRR